MNRTAVLQIYLALFVFYGLGNVIYTELSGKGIYSMLKPARYHGKSNEAIIAIAVEPKWLIICLNIQKTPRQRCFKYFTAIDGGWIESRIQKYDAPEDNS